MEEVSPIRFVYFLNIFLEFSFSNNKIHNYVKKKIEDSCVEYLYREDGRKTR